MPAQIVLNWDANPADEQVTGYRVYQDGAEIASVPAPPATIDSVPEGRHDFTVAAVNVWGPGPQSDPVSTPPAASKPLNVRITINVSVSVG